MIMLRSAEANLVERDSALPGLATLLDPDAFAAVLSRRLPASGLRAARISYIKYKPRTNCLVSYRLHSAAGSVTATAKAYPRGAPLRLTKCGGMPAASDMSRLSRLLFNDCAILVSIFPHDRAIKALRRLSGPDARIRMIRRVLGRTRAELWGGAMEELAYKPERRYVAKLSAGEEPRAVLKFYAEANYRTAWNNSWAFESRENLRLAPRIGDSDRYGVLAYEWLPGRLLRDAILDQDCDVDVMRAVGAAIAELHAQNSAEVALRTFQSEASALVCEAATLGFLCPPLARPAAKLAHRLANRLMDIPAVICPIHGDLHPGQILLNGENVALLDLDRAIRANPVSEIALLVAHLDREVVRGTLAVGYVEQLAAALLEGYCAASGSTTVFQLYRAASLLRLAPEFFRYYEPDWPTLTAATLQRAEDIMKQA